MDKALVVHKKSKISVRQKLRFCAFQDKKIRRIWHNNEWFFSIVDILAVLTDSTIPRRYWSDLKIKLKDEGFELYDKIVQLD